jgi:two-component system, OmpR family, phosphate regulon sensor histidine kinase PhoR
VVTRLWRRRQAPRPSAHDAEHPTTIAEVGTDESPTGAQSRPGDLASYEELRTGFTAAVSHELRTPLARVLALLETALLPGSEMTPLVEQARAEVEQTRELIDEILFLSELETGLEVVSLGSTRIAGVAAEVFSELRDRADRAGVELRSDVEPDVELPLRRRLVRVLMENLAENAIRYAGEGAVFTLSARRQDDRLLLIASDTGAGVASADLPRLFERFFRADRARASRGTGLGLAIVKHIVTAAGGTVEALRPRGSGLVIRCTFPA